MTVWNGMKCAYESGGKVDRDVPRHDACLLGAKRSWLLWRRRTHDKRRATEKRVSLALEYGCIGPGTSLSTRLHLRPNLIFHSL
jgi:hypothetical protein